MHLLTGMIIAGLLGRGAAAQRSPLLTAVGPIQTAHLLAGRVRFRVARLQDNPQLCTDLARRLSQIEGVRQVGASACSGSVLIHFDQDTVQADLLAAAIVRLLGLEEELRAPPTPKLVEQLHDLGSALNRATLEESRGLIDLKTALPLALGAVGLVRLANPSIPKWPAPIAMIWWAYSSLGRGPGGRR
jgi:hypothetical protein